VSCFVFVVLMLAASAARAQVSPTDNNVEQNASRSNPTVTAMGYLGASALHLTEHSGAVASGGLRRGWTKIARPRYYSNERSNVQYQTRAI
jgi:hypothetical protein